MKTYKVDIDVTVSVQMYVEARSDIEAEAMAMAKIKRDTLYHIQDGCYVGADVVECYELFGE